MALITWLGEDEPGRAGPSFTTWYGMEFHKDKAVSVTNPEMIRRAKNNLYFRVEDEEVKRGPGRPPKVRTDGDDKDAH